MVSFLIRALLFIIVVIAVVIAIALGISWVLALILPFSLFEGAQLTLLASIVIVLVVHTMMDGTVTPAEWEEDESDPLDEPHIPEDRFWTTEEEHTWHNWLRLLVANSIYSDMVKAEGWIGEMTPQRQEQIAIELTDGAVKEIQSKARRGRELRVSRDTLRRVLQAKGQRPYDDELINLAAQSCNNVLRTLRPIITDVSNDRAWNERVS